MATAAHVPRRRRARRTTKVLVIDVGGTNIKVGIAA
jgi:hexokinase